MEFLSWFQRNYVDLFQTLSIVVMLFYTAHSSTEETKSRKISNQIALKKEHREIWSEPARNPKLRRVENMDVDLQANPITYDEKLFLKKLVVHLDSAYRAGMDGMFMSPEAFRNDVKDFFSRPIPKLGWEELKLLQDPVFAAFVDDCCNS